MRRIQLFEAYSTGLYSQKYNKEFPLERITEEEFGDLLKTHCRQFLEVCSELDWSEISRQEYPPKNLIYRKFRSNYGDFVLSNPKESDFRRIAPFARSNWHNLMISNLDSWSSYPRRNKSMICAGRARAMEHFGEELYVIIPFDTSKIGVCSAYDFWDGFKNILPKYYDISIWVPEVLNRLSREINVQFRNHDSWGEIYPYLNRKYDIEFGSLWEEYDKNITLLDNLNLFLDPKRNGFELCNFKRATDILEESCRECWFEDEAIAVRWDWINSRVGNFSTKVKRFFTDWRFEHLFK